MTEQHALVAAVRFQRFAADLPAGMGDGPGIRFGVLLLAAEAEVFAGNGLLRVDAAALRAVPVEEEGGLGHVLPLVRVVARLVLVVPLFLRDAVVRPSLDAREMQETEAVLTGPYRLVAPHPGDADETGSRVRLELVLQRVLGFFQVFGVAAVRFEHGLHHIQWDISLLFFFTRLVGMSTHGEN